MSITTKMSSRSRTSSSRTSVTTNPNLALTKAIQSVVKQQEGFEKKVSDWQDLVANTFGDLELRLEAKRKELSDLDVQYEQSENNRRVEVDLAIKEHGYTAACNILEARGDIAVPKTDYEELKNSYESIKASKDQEVKDAVEQERGRNHRHLEAMKTTLELQKKAEVAQVEAKLETQIQHIEVLKSTIENLKNDLNEQRKLTKDVAQASAKSMPMYMQQPSRS